MTTSLVCEGVSFCDHGHSIYRGGTDMTVFCFAQRQHAEQFQARFGGELIDPKHRPRLQESP